MIGTLEEAREIQEKVSLVYAEEGNVEQELPEGWRFIGSGSSRMAFESPTGVVYKVERYSEDGWNVQEQVNFDHIRENCKLPEGWRIPESTLYQFIGNVYKWQYKGPVLRTEQVISVIALEFVKGEAINYSDDENRSAMRRGMDTIGMIDGARGNVLKTEDGFCIVDAGEGMLPDSVYENYEGVVFARLEELEAV